MNQPLKPASILCIAHNWFPGYPGGLDRYVYELTQHFAAEQDQVELCVLGIPALSANTSPKTLRLTNLAEPEDSLWERLWLIHKNFSRRQAAKPDVINLHFSLYSLPILHKLPARVPVIFTFHGPWASECEQEGASALGVSVMKWIERWVYHRCDRFIVLSKAFGTILHEEYQISWEKIDIVPGGVDTTRFQPNLSRQAARAQLNWEADRTILFTSRRLVQRMGLDKLLTALAQIKPQVPNLWLAIAGRGPLQETLERQVQELALENDVKFLGFLPDEQLPIAYQAADLTVVPSQSLEGFGLILLESLACGTPTLCTPIGGMPEVLQPFCPHLITQSAEATAIAERLRELLTGELPLPSRTDCQEYVSTHFDWHVIAPQIRRVLLEDT